MSFVSLVAIGKGHFESKLAFSTRPLDLGGRFRKSVIAVVLFFALARAASSFGQIPDSPSGLAIQPIISLATNAASADSDFTKPGRPGVACDGTNYLVVSCRFDNSPPGIFGVIVSRRGEVMNTFQITDESFHFSNPTAAFNGTNYFVVFDESGQIYGIRVSLSGQLLDPSPGFQISSATSPDFTSHWGPSVSCDGQDCLVVWDRFSTNYDIYGAIVLPNGTTAGQFPILTAPGEQVESTVTFGAGNYFVAWRDTRSGSGPAPDTHVFGTRVDPQGTILDSSGIAICIAPGPQGEPHTAFDGQNYFVSWSDARLTHSYSAIFGARLSPAGIVLDGPAESGGIAIDQSLTDMGDSRVVFDGQDLLVTWWVASYTEPKGIFAARVSTGGLLLDGPVTGPGILLGEDDASAGRYVYPNPVSNGHGVLVAWLETLEEIGETKNLLGRLVVRQPTITTLAVTRSGTPTVIIDFNSLRDQEYHIETSTDLTTWNPVGGPLLGTGGYLKATVTTAVFSQAGFFRVAVDY